MVNIGIDIHKLFWRITALIEGDIVLAATLARPTYDSFRKILSHFVKGDVGSKTTYDNYIKTCDLKSRNVLSQLLIEKGLIMEQEYFTKLKKV